MNGDSMKICQLNNRAQQIFILFKMFGSKHDAVSISIL